MWIFLVILAVIKYSMLVFTKNDRFTRQRFQIKYEILGYFNQTLYLIGRIMRVLGPHRVLDPPRILCPPRVLGPHSVLGRHRVLGPPKVLGRPRVLGPHSVLNPPGVVGPWSSQGPGSRFSGTPNETQILTCLMKIFKTIV